MPSATPPFKRLLSNYLCNPATGCWEWKGSTMKNGYGQLKVFGKMVSTHTYSYLLHKGEIPAGMEVMHECDNKICINPDHLACGTHSQNMRDAANRGRITNGRSHPHYGKPGRSGIENAQSLPVRVKGKVYGSKNQAEIILGLGAGTVNYWIKNKPHLACEITRKDYQNA